MRAISLNNRRPWRATALRAVSMLAVATIALSLGGCAAGMGAMMTGGGMHGGQGGEAAAYTRLYAPGRLLEQADALRLTAEQVVALQRVWDLQRDGQASASISARNSREVLTEAQRRVVEGRPARETPAAPMPRHH